MPYFFLWVGKVIGFFSLKHVITKLFELAFVYSSCVYPEDKFRLNRVKLDRFIVLSILWRGTFKSEKSLLATILLLDR